MPFVACLACMALLTLGGCDSFPAACESNADCADAALCEQGECLAVSPGLLDRCRGDESFDELCNGGDDDCDGEIDEGCAVGDVCTAGEGVCARPGILAETPLGLMCSAVPGPARLELCNGEDDDCDGDTDETCGAGDMCQVGRGGCRREGTLTERDGSNVCLGATSGQPVVPGAPVDEVCNDRVDNDCDGILDEGFEQLGDVCLVGEGICQNEGELVCVTGTVRCNVDAGRPESERCNTRDDDCDGMVDEDFTVGESCGVGTGACRSSTVWSCNPAGDGVRCTAVEGQPSEEQCNGIDDDCDGRTDEGDDGTELIQPCGNDLGICRTGIERCVDGFFGDCEGGVRPEPRELCDNLDNNCDGTVDNFTRPCGSDIGICRLGTQMCAVGAWGACTNSIEPSPETCDGRDEDCDGAVDEADGTGIPSSLTQVCGAFEGGECRRGVRTCGPGGVFGPCVGAQDPVADVCDGLDNDCDGDIDEEHARLGDPCTAGVGPCLAEGVFVCEPGADRTICGAVPAADQARPETCDGRDDDCDARIDETFFLGTACLADNGSAGVCTCDVGATVACSVGGVRRRVAENRGNGRDDDCDGRVDEG